MVLCISYLMVGNFLPFSVKIWIRKPDPYFGPDLLLDLPESVRWGNPWFSVFLLEVLF